MEKPLPLVPPPKGSVTVDQADDGLESWERAFASRSLASTTPQLSIRTKVLSDDSPKFVWSSPTRTAGPGLPTPVSPYHAKGVHHISPLSFPPLPDSDDEEDEDDVYSLEKHYSMLRRLSIKGVDHSTLVPPTPPPHETGAKFVVHHEVDDRTVAGSPEPESTENGSSTSYETEFWSDEEDETPAASKKPTTKLQDKLKDEFDGIKDPEELRSRLRQLNLRATGDATRLTDLDATLARAAAAIEILRVCGSEVTTAWNSSGIKEQGKLARVGEAVRAMDEALKDVGDWRSTKAVPRIKRT